MQTYKKSTLTRHAQVSEYQACAAAKLRARKLGLTLIPAHYTGQMQTIQAILNRSRS
ncbi:hypothetical protein [Fibrivirga algicola]|uniref:hypothetical protein n=1 Tax=Fibrivirga algicola TaxID=2950420 RepID=UPI001419304B|nr:hypothetical protein [Fibrivirga algicola]